MLQLAQDGLGIDPTEIGKQLGQAQDVQTVLGTIVGVLLVAILALIYFYLREKKAWNLDKEKLLDRWSNAKVDWETERTEHQRALKEQGDKAAKEKEGLMREMLNLALKIEKSLDKLAAWKEARE